MKTPQKVGKSTIHSAIARTLADTLEAHGCQSDRLFHKFNLDPEANEDIDQRVLGEAVQQIWSAGVEETGNEALGLSFAENFHPGALHGLGFSWATSDTLFEAFLRLARYFKVISTDGEVVVRRGEKTVYLWLKLPVPFDIVVPASIDAGLALFLQLCRFAKDSSLQPLRVDMQRAKPVNPDTFSKFFGCDIRYGAEKSALIFKRSVVEEPLPIANQKLARANDQVVADYLKQFETENMANRVTSTIIELLPSGVPTTSTLARHLNVSERKLQRMLNAENTQFSHLLDQVRLDLAKNYLVQPTRSIGEISFLLGYTEPANFSRSFKRLTGLTPETFRKGGK